MSQANFGLERPAVLKQPVMDEANLPGKYNWNVLFDKQSPNSISDAIRQELGLELKPAQRHVEVMTVEVK